VFSWTRLNGARLKAAISRLAGRPGSAFANSSSGVATAAHNEIVTAGERSVAIGGNVDKAAIVTGDIHQPVLNAVLSADAAAQILGEVYPPRLHQLPPPPADFTGREAELLELRAAFSDPGPLLCSIVGMGGVGKTALALAMAQQFLPRYPDAQLFIDLQGSSLIPASPAAIQSRVISALSPQASLPDEDVKLADLYRTVLHGKRVLLLFDDARDTDQLAALLPPSSCGLLVTGRQMFALPGLHSQRLHGLAPDDARRLLSRIAPRIAALAEPIAEACAYLPLALRMAASTLATRVNLDPQSYLDRLRDTRARLDLVNASVALSYDLLTAEQQRLWRWLAVFSTGFGPAAAAAIWGVDREHAEATLGDLVQCSLVEWDPTARRYHLHELLRLFAAAQLSPQETEDAGLRHAAYYQFVLSKAQDIYLTGGEGALTGLRLFDLERANIVAGQAWVAARLGSSEDAARLCSAYAGQGAHILRLRLHPEERVAWLQAAMAAARRVSNRQAELVHSGNLANAYRARGQPRLAIRIYQQQRSDAQADGDLLSEATAVGNLGSAFAETGEMTRSVSLFRQQLQLARQIPDRRQELQALHNLAVACTRLGYLRRSETLFIRALGIAREAGERLEEAEILGGLGNVCLERGERKQANSLYEAQLAIAREFGDRRQEAAVLGNLGHLAEDLDRYDHALELHQQQIDIARELGDRRREGSGLHNRGHLCLRLGDLDRAQADLTEALAIAREVGDRGGEANALGNLARVALARGDYRQSIELSDRTAGIAHELGDRRDEGNALWNRSLAFQQLGDYMEAVGSANSALALYEAIHSPRVPLVREYLERWQRRLHPPWWQFWRR